MKNYLARRRASGDRRRESAARGEYAGPWFPEPLLTGPAEDPARSAELADSASLATLLLREPLGPPERAPRLLREVCGYDFPEIAAAMWRAKAACRQFAARFFAPFGEGEVARLRAFLAADVQLVGDSRAKVGIRQEHHQCRNVAQLHIATLPWLVRTGATLVPRGATGQPGTIYRAQDSKVLSTLALDIIGGGSG
jgi:RNA polymerase sigma-70 factor (ECF subfamily)